MFFLGLVKSTLLYACAVMALRGSAAAVVPGVLYILLFAVALIKARLSFRRLSRAYRGSVASTVAAQFVADINNPFRGLFALVGARKVIDGSRGRRAYSWSVVWLHFLWSIALLVTVTLVAIF